MNYTVAQSGMNWGHAKRYICDAEGNVVAEAFGEDVEDAEERAEVIAEALTEDTHSCDQECGETEACPFR